MTILGKRGFVTIATGSEHYYMLAANLLRSYRLNTDHSCPFAIIAESENKYTSEFDHVILMHEASHNYLDKLKLAEYLPYEETIFIDADCLVYGDINQWWDIFGKGDDFSFFGYAYTDLNTDRGWFMTEGMKEYRDQIHYVPSGSSGICYLRNTDTCRKVFEIANFAAAHYSDYAFNVFSHPADEPVLALGMAVCDCRPADCFEVAIFNKTHRIDCDILVPYAFQTIKQEKRAARLVHWGNPSTRRSQYLFESSKMNAFLQGKDHKSLSYRLLYEKGLKRRLLFVYDIAADFRGLKRRVLKKLKNR